jgi:hypothetical protein
LIAEVSLQETAFLELKTWFLENTRCQTTGGIRKMRFVVGAMMVIFFFAGVGLFWKGLQSLFQMIRRRPRLLSAQGTVLKVERKVDIMGTTRQQRRRGGNISHYPVIHFLNDKGESVSFRSEIGDKGQTSSYYTGQVLPVLYDPEGEMPPMIDSWSGIWLIPISLTVAGVVFVGGSLIIWFAFGERIMGGAF